MGDSFSIVYYDEWRPVSQQTGSSSVMVWTSDSYQSEITSSIVIPHCKIPARVWSKSCHVSPICNVAHIGNIDSNIDMSLLRAANIEVVRAFLIR